MNLICEHENSQIYHDNRCIKRFKNRLMFENTVKFHKATADMPFLLQPLEIRDMEIHYPWMEHPLAHMLPMYTQEQKNHIFESVCSMVYQLFERGIAHGDLHLEHVFMVDDKPILFDPWYIEIPTGTSFRNSHDVYCIDPNSPHANKEKKPCLKLLGNKMGVAIDPYEYVSHLVKEEIKQFSGSETYDDMRGKTTYSSYDNKNFTMAGWRGTKIRIDNFINNAGVDFKGKTVLDLGCNCGAISLYLAELGAKVTGVDVSPERVSLCKRLNRFLGLNAEFGEFNLSAANPISGDYDIIIAFAITGRVADETTILHDIYSHCKELLFESNNCKKDKYEEIFRTFGFNVIKHLGNTGPDFPARITYYCKKE